MALRMFLAVVLGLVLACTGALAASIPCYINEDTVIYSYPGDSSQALSVPSGLPCEMTAVHGDWAMVTRSGANAFIPLKYLTLAQPIDARAVEAAAMYACASADSQKLGTIPAGTPVCVVGRDGAFFRVRDASGGIEGYVAATSLAPESAAAAEDSGASTAESRDSGGEMSNAEKIDCVLATAEALYGRPYAEASQPPDSFNSAGFVAFCFAQVDVALPLTAHGQGFDGDYAVVTGAANLQRGDIVCFDTDSSDENPSDHTGIYLGDGYFVHASSSAGQVVVSSLSSGYYKSAFSWGRRILE